MLPYLVFFSPVTELIPWIVLDLLFNNEMFFCTNSLDWIYVKYLFVSFSSACKSFFLSLRINHRIHYYYKLIIFTPSKRHRICHFTRTESIICFYSKLEFHSLTYPMFSQNREVHKHVVTRSCHYHLTHQYCMLRGMIFVNPLNRRISKKGLKCDFFIRTSRFVDADKDGSKCKRGLEM